MSTVYEKSLRLHEKHKGKIEVVSKIKVENLDDLSLAYTPGVAQPCLEIEKDRENAYRYTSKGNLVAVVSDGSAVLGLGNIGPDAAMPVMEGKAILFKEFANIDAFPICLDTQDDEEIIKTVKYLAPSFGGINLEDIAAPRCFEIERRLIEELDIPVFHDDQHGTAIVTSAGVINALKLVNKSLETSKFVISGAGSAGISICKLLIRLGVSNIILSDRKGLLCSNEEWMNDAQKQIAKITNPQKIRGNLADAMKESDVFIGVSGPKTVSIEMVKSMNKDAIVFAMANPEPEIYPEDAKQGGARIVASGRSDYPNQINNVLVFPGIFRGALDARANAITEDMKIAAAKAIANIIPENELREDYIIPNSFNKEVVKAVAKAVSDIAISNRFR